MPDFRKKPVVISAVQWNGEDAEYDAIERLAAQAASCTISLADGELYIETLEGTMSADFGDWVICGVKGEMYPCKPDVFAQTYDPA